MHESAMKYGKKFFETYCARDFTGKIIVDVGAQDINGSLRTYCPAGAEYKGVDFVDGRGVDILITDPYRLPFEDDTVDVVVCSSVFEHAEFFWLLYLECVRITKPSGLIYLNAPSNGMVHRYPIDSWRFYPDAGLSLVNWSRHNGYDTVLLESFLGSRHGQINGEGMWNDFVAVIVKDQRFASLYPQRIQDSAGVFHCGYDTNKEAVMPNYSYPPDYSLIIGQQSTIEALNQSTEKKDSEITHLTEALQERNSQLDVLSQEAQRLKALSEKATGELESVLRSQSWYLTKPLRFLKRLLLRVPGRLQPGLYHSLKIIWRCLPLSVQHKTRIRQLLNIRITADQADHHNIPTIVFDDTHEGYTEYHANPAINPAVKLIAFYLPQFHPFPENDEWWGKGFTEWSNVAKAEKNYIGHYQPHCPIHNGYYDLRVPSVMEEQASLAKQYGIHGFSYYFYWFAGKILMDTPLEMMLANPKVDLPFCLTWANENWTRRWDGQENDVLIAQAHSDEDSLAFIQYLVKFFNDPRYIRINGRPVLIIYRASLIPDMAHTVNVWREEIKKHGFSDLYLICAQSFGILGPEAFGFDASVEFPPHTAKSYEISHQLTLTNPNFKGCIYSYEQVAAAAVREKEPDYKLFRTAMLSWDNTARKQNQSHSFHGFSLMRYKQWLSALCSNMAHAQKYDKDEKLVFINAWNEWAEGTHLEPDRKYGYGYLQATYDVVANYDESLRSDFKSPPAIRTNKVAVMLHIHYFELWSEIKEKLAAMTPLGFDLFVTTTKKETIDLVLADYPMAVVELYDNRGRDVLPFIKMIDRVKEQGYSAVCKVHTKRSLHRVDGDHIRMDLLGSLMGDEKSIRAIVERFESNSTLGMIIPERYLMAHNATNMADNRTGVATACEVLGIDFHHDVFPAGSMFWFRPEALADLSLFTSADFDIEHGLVDGTLPHTIERVFCLLAKKSGYSVEVC